MHKECQQAAPHYDSRVRGVLLFSWHITSFSLRPWLELYVRADHLSVRINVDVIEFGLQFLSRRPVSASIIRLQCVNQITVYYIAPGPLTIALIDIVFTFSDVVKSAEQHIDGHELFSSRMLQLPKKLSQPRARTAMRKAAPRLPGNVDAEVPSSILRRLRSRR